MFRPPLDKHPLIHSFTCHPLDLPNFSPPPLQTPSPSPQSTSLGLALTSTYSSIVENSSICFVILEFFPLPSPSACWAGELAGYVRVDFSKVTIDNEQWHLVSHPSDILLPVLKRAIYPSPISHAQVASSNHTSASQYQTQKRQCCYYCCPSTFVSRRPVIYAVLKQDVPFLFPYSSPYQILAISISISEISSTRLSPQPTLPKI
jgi:hypothetical protein